MEKIVVTQSRNMGSPRVSVRVGKAFQVNGISGDPGTF